MSFAQIAADAFSNALGSAIVGQMQQSQMDEQLDEIEQQQRP